MINYLTLESDSLEPLVARDRVGLPIESPTTKRVRRRPPPTLLALADAAARMDPQLNVSARKSDPELHRNA